MPFKRDGRWVAKVVVNGRQHWVGSGYATKTEARKAEDEFRDGMLHPAPTVIETCDSFASRWPGDYPRPKTSTNRYNAERVKQFAEDFRGCPLAAVDRPMARKWAIRHPDRLNAVRAMYSDAMNDGIVPKNPFMGLRLPQGRGRKDIEVLSEQELHRIASLGPQALGGQFGAEFGAMLLFAAYTGIRPGEMFLLEWGDIEGQYLTISKAVNKYGIPDTPKNGKARVVPIPPPAYEQLAVLPRDRTHLFVGKAGFRLTHGSHWSSWNTLRSFAGHVELDWYACTRHYCATYLLELGLKPGDVALQLGHTDGGALVMSTYGHPSDERARKRILEAFVPKEAEGNVTPIRKTGA